MPMQWTEKQKDVIRTRGRNMLVSAAAGSGKTAVLVERMIEKILDPEHPVDADRMLVVTFTKAAASEMRERVISALDKAFEKNPQDENIKRQQTYIHNAKITTIDSFCAWVVREYFDRINLDPDTRIVDDAQIKMIETDVLKEMTEEYFEKGDEAFLSLADRYMDPKHPDALSGVILRLYDAASSHERPEVWLEGCRETYRVKSAAEAEQTPWMRKLMSIIQTEMTELENRAMAAAKLCETENGPLAYEDDLLSFIARVRIVKESATYDEKRSAFNDIVWERLPSVSKKDCDPVIKEQVTKIRDGLKKKKKTLSNTLFLRDLEGKVTDIARCGDVVDKLIDLTLDFSERFAAAKRDKRVMDFQDQEHFALKILVEYDDSGQAHPTAAAREIAGQFEEIMIDEYQDSNSVQEAILTSVSKGGGVNNIFMVGDVKQCIYKFRLANPELFVEKFNTYSTDLTADNCKIVLDKNFRSRIEIIKSVNELFGRIMHRDLGGIEYNDGNGLTFGATHFPSVPFQNENSTRLLISDASGNESEAMIVAGKIKQMLDPDRPFLVTGDDGSLRPVRYRDIVILLRGVKDRGDDYVKALSSEGIPSYCESKTGYYNAREVRTILDYLSVIDNPLQDIPLASVMRSEMYGFTSQELALIKAHGDGGYFYDRVRMYEKSGGDFKLRKKVSRLLSDIARYRAMTPYTGVYDFVTLILSETGYGDMILALPGGERREKNLEVLREKAATYDDGAYKGIFNFLRYVEKTKEVGMDQGEASAYGEHEDIVRIMTFHKSKGLQFPVVFVSGLGTKFNEEDTKGSVAVHEKYGIGIDFINQDNKLKIPTAIRMVINQVIKEESYAEEIRLLYVAMTRAQEKMILTAVNSNMEKKAREWIYSLVGEQGLTAGQLMAANSPIDWIGLSVSKTQGFDGIRLFLDIAEEYADQRYGQSANFYTYWVSEHDLEARRIENTADSALTASVLKKRDPSLCRDDPLYKLLSNRFAWKYANAYKIAIPSKMSVSEIKTMHMRHNEEEDGLRLNYDTGSGADKPGAVTGAERGTACHKIFELFDYSVDATEENIRAMVENIKKSGKLDSRAASLVDPEDFVRFSRTDLYRRMKAAAKAGTLKREQKFMMGIPADRLFPEKAGSGSDNGAEFLKSQNKRAGSDDDLILVQGVIDAYFVEDGKYVVVDYKTDAVRSMEELSRKYSAQLFSYAAAVAALEAPPDSIAKDSSGVSGGTGASREGQSGPTEAGGIGGFQDEEDGSAECGNTAGGAVCEKIIYSVALGQYITL